MGNAVIAHYANTVTLKTEEYDQEFTPPSPPPKDATEDDFQKFAQKLRNFDAWLRNRSLLDPEFARGIEGQKAYAVKAKLETILGHYFTKVVNKEYQLNDIQLTGNDDTNLDIITSIARSRGIIYFMIGIVIVFFYLRIAPTTEEYALGIPYETIRAIAVIMLVSMGTLHSLWFEMRSQSSQDPLQSWDTSPAWKLLSTASIALVFCSLLWHNTSIKT
jgi:hypothetical protein